MLNKKAVIYAFILIIVFVGFILFLKPKKQIGSNDPVISEVSVVEGIKSSDIEAEKVNSETLKVKTHSALLDQVKKIDAEDFVEIGIKKNQRVPSLSEDDFIEVVRLEDGREMPVFKSNILGDDEKIAVDFEFEARNEEWASTHEHTLKNIASNASSTFDMAYSDIKCKSKTCKIGIKLSEKNPYGFEGAFRSLNREFVINNMQVIPGPIEEKGTGLLVYYYYPDN